jgi:hypothetical protein
MRPLREDGARRRSLLPGCAATSRRKKSAVCSQWNEVRCRPTSADAAKPLSGREKPPLLSTAPMPSSSNRAREGRKR